MVPIDAATRDPVYADFLMPDHGVFVSGIIREIAPYAEVRLLRVLSDYGVCDLHRLANALNLLASTPRPATTKLIVNLSLVSEIPPCGTSTYIMTHNPVYVALHVAIQNLAKSGALIIASAGNDDTLIQDCHGLPDTPDPKYPARFPEVFSVASLDRQRRKSRFSNRAAVSGVDNGIAVWGGNAVLEDNSPEDLLFIDLTDTDPVTNRLDAVMGIYGKTSTLPMDRIYNPSTGGPAPARPNTTGWVYWAGTSYATAIISGIAANVWAKQPALPPPVNAAGDVVDNTGAPGTVFNASPTIRRVIQDKGVSSAASATLRCNTIRVIQT
jgi:subtilisin family serine protease